MNGITGPAGAGTDPGTERERVAAALQQSEQKYRALFDSIDQGFCIVQVIFDDGNRPLDLRFVEVNRAFEQLTGLRQPVGRTALNLIPTLETSWLSIQARVALTGVPVRFENQVEVLDRWFNVYSFRIGEPHEHKVASLFGDITEQRTARERLEQLVAERTAELRESTTMLASLIEASPLAVVSMNRDRRVQLWNRAAETIFGWTAAEAVGDVPPNIPEGMESYAQTMFNQMFAGLAIPPHDTKRRRKDGTLIDVHVLPAPMRREDGTVYAAMAMLQDISDRKAMEREREQLLRRVVESQEEERQRIARELHDEMGQHLTALKVSLESLPQSSEVVERMKDIVTRLDESVDRLTLELRPPALDDLGLHGAITSYAEQFSATSGLRTDLHLPGIQGDRFDEKIEVALYRVVQEALTNVWKHAGARSVSVIVERQPGGLQLIVEDDGCGFDETAAVPDANRRGRFGLLGIRERVSLIGGTFNIESAPGRGTTLYVRVPLELP